MLLFCSSLCCLCIIIIIMILLAIFSFQQLLRVFPWSPGLFSVFWSISPMLYFRWSRFVLWFLTLPFLFPSFLHNFPSTPVIPGINVTLIFLSFLSSLARFKYLSHFSVVRWDGKVLYTANSFFFKNLFLWSGIGDLIVVDQLMWQGHMNVFLTFAFFIFSLLSAGTAKSSRW